LNTPGKSGRHSLQDALFLMTSPWLRNPDGSADGQVHPTFDETVTAVFLIALLGAACLMPLQNDTWWHLRAGEEMWAHGSVMLADEFSFTARGAHWPNHEWLSEIVFYGVYRVGGLALLTFLTAACVTAAIGMSWRLMTGSALARLVLIAAGIPSLAFVWAVRPHVFSQVLLMATVHLCLRRAFWVLPPIFALWANLHGAVALGFVVLGAVMLSDAYLLGIRRALRIVPLIAVCFAATMVSPLGFDLWPTIPESIHKSVSNGIGEWRAPVLGWRDLGFWLLAALFIITLVRKWRSIRDYHDAVIAIAALLLLPLALRHGRNMTPFALLALPAISRMIPLPALVQRGRKEHARLNAALVTACVLAVAVTVAREWSRPAPRLHWDPISARVVEAIQGCPGRLYNRYDDGGYVIWFARIPVYADSRQDPYPLEFVQEHLRHEISGEYVPVFEKYNLRCAFLPPGSPTAQRMLADGWQVAASDERWVVLYPRRAQSSAP
jgi:hypothetical protein